MIISIQWKKWVSEVLYIYIQFQFFSALYTLSFASRGNNISLIITNNDLIQDYQF